MLKLLLTMLLAALLTRRTLAIACGGCVDLDEINFDKTIVRFPYALVKFDIAFPYGEKHEAFAEFSKAAHKVTAELLVATVGIKDYGEQENKALGERFKLNEKQFPGIFLFKGNVNEFVKFPAHLDVTLDNLKTFVSSNTPLYIGCDGCLKEFNEALKNYANRPHDEQLALIKELQAKAQELSNKFNEQQNAKVYLVYMQKINELGYSFVEEETKRLQRLKAGKVTAAKKLELQHRLNILDAFRVHKLTKAAPEKAKAEL